MIADYLKVDVLRIKIEGHACSGQVLVIFGRQFVT